MIDILYIKAVHIIFVTTWFAGLFYIVRLFIYFIEAGGKDEPERGILRAQYKIMAARLWYIITWPSAVLVGVSAAAMLAMQPDYLSAPWMHVKLAFVGLLYLYHFRCHSYFKQMQAGVINASSKAMRLWNEGASVLLFAIVFTVVLKTAMSWVYGIIGVFILAIVLMVSVRLYGKVRKD